MGRASDAAKCLALALLNLADDEGYFQASPTLVRNFARPFDPDTSTTESLITDLSVIEWCVVRDHGSHGPIGWILNFVKHQAINRAKNSSLKAYFKEGQPRITDRSRIDPIRKGMEGNGREGKKPRAREADPSPEKPTTPFVKHLEESWPEVEDPPVLGKAITDAHPNVDHVAIAKAARARWVADGNKTGKPAAAYLAAWFAREKRGPPIHLAAVVSRQGQPEVRHPEQRAPSVEDTDKLLARMDEQSRKVEAQRASGFKPPNPFRKAKEPNGA